MRIRDGALFAGLILVVGCGGAREAEVPAAEPVVAVEAAAEVALSDERVMELGRMYADALYQRDVERLWQAFDQDMRAGMGSAEIFGNTVDAMLAQLGQEIVVEGEEVVDAGQDGIKVYTRVARFTEGEQRAQMTMAFRPDERIAGLFVRPAP